MDAWFTCSYGHQCLRKSRKLLSKLATERGLPGESAGRLILILKTK